MIKLIDTKGLDGSVETEDLIIEEMTNSDIIFWVLKANQSARKLDEQLRNKFDEFYKKTDNRGRKRPVILALVNQIDKLKPIKDWNPPYDLINCDTADKKAKVAEKLGDKKRLDDVYLEWWEPTESMSDILLLIREC